MAFDYSDHVSTLVQEGFARLNALAYELNSAEREVIEAEAALKGAKNTAKDISERQLPELMDQMGLSEFITTAGIKVKIKKSIHAGITKANQAEAYKWLDDNGYGGIIKRNVTVRFAKDQEDAARKLVAELGSQFPQVSEGMKIEPSTLKAFVRERLEEGAAIDIDLFGIFERRIVQVSS